MTPKGDCLIIGDAMIPAIAFERSARARLADYVDQILCANWEENWDRLQKRRLLVEKNGPACEEVPPLIRTQGKEATMLIGLFVPVSHEALACMPNLRLVGIARAGSENVDIQAATDRGIAVCHVRGRNAQAVSDFTVGLMLAECRNIARAHHAMVNGRWQKEFPNSAHVPELRGKTVGIIGFGHIGSLVAQKLSGFEVTILVHDPHVSAETITQTGCRPAEKKEIFQQSDFLTLHARLTSENKNLVGPSELALMKSTSYIINTARAGLIDKDALLHHLRSGKLAGAALDVFWQEPLTTDDELLQLECLTLTSHLAGTTKEALARSPELLTNNIIDVIKEGSSGAIINPAVMGRAEFTSWQKKLTGTTLD